IYWFLTDEAPTGVAKEMAPLLAQHGQEWFPVAAWSVTGSKKSAGICKLTGDQLNRIDCLGGNAPGFPLADTTFVIVNLSTGRLPTYKCATGCPAGAVTALYQMPYEDGENRDFVKAYQRFQKQCPKAE